MCFRAATLVDWPVVRLRLYKMERGYIALWRKSLDSRIFNNEGLWKVWTWCLMKATHKKRWTTLKTGRGNIDIEILPGQFVFGRHSAAKELKMNPSTVWKRIVKLKNTSNLNIESNRQYSIINIINWDIYQPQKNNSNIESNKQVTGKEQASDTDNNVDNVNNVKKEKKINKRKTLLPENYSLNEKHIKYAESKNITTGIEDMFEAFCINHRKRGTQFASWYAAWQTWVRNKIQWDKEKQGDNDDRFDFN